MLIRTKLIGKKANSWKECVFLDNENTSRQAFTNYPLFGKIFSFDDCLKLGTSKMMDETHISDLHTEGNMKNMFETFR